MKSKWSEPEFRQIYKNVWSDPSYRIRASNLTKDFFANESPSSKKARAAKLSALWCNPGYRKNVIEKLKNRWKNPELRRINSERSKEKWKDEDFRALCAQKRASQSGRKSSIETITESILLEYRINHKTQVPVGPYLFDFLVPEHNLYIECQGEYWQSLPGRESRDIAKRAYLEKSINNAKLLYLYEREFLNPEIIINKIRSFIDSPPIEKHTDFDFNDLSISNINTSESISFLRSFHYASYGRNGIVSYGAYLNTSGGNKLIAVAKFSRVIRKEVATSMNMDHKIVAELDRLAIHQYSHKKNFASWFLSRITKLFFSDFDDVKRLVSFADLTYGHNGTVYKASNWVKITVSPPDYYYVGPDGFILHKKTLYNQAVRISMKEKEYADKHGYVKNYGREKIKFVLDRK